MNERVYKTDLSEEHRRRMCDSKEHGQKQETNAQGAFEARRGSGLGARCLDCN